MAWFGEGFSNLKGQISNFTKEIVTNNILPLENAEEKESPEDNKRVDVHTQQLEAHCKEQDEEINKLRLENIQLRKLVTGNTPRDRHHSEEASFDCESLGFNNANLSLSAWEEVAEPFLGQEHGSDLNNSQKIPKDTKSDEELVSLRSKLRKTFQEKVLLEQVCSRLEKDVSLLSQQVSKNKQQQLTQADEIVANLVKQQKSTQTGETVRNNQSCNCMTPELASLLEENDHLKQERLNMRQEINTMSRNVQDLESQVAVSQDENSNLSTGLEEMDISYQQEIEQLMTLKDTTKKRYDILLSEHEEMKKNYEDLINLSKIKIISCSVETQTSQIEDSSKEQTILETYHNQINDHIQTLMSSPIPEEFFTKDSTSNLFPNRLNALINMCSYLSETLENNKVKEKNLLQEIKERDEELLGLESENSTLREKLQELTKGKETLAPIFENSEEFETLENKCSSLESENSILNEVRSNLEAEINQLKSQIDILVYNLQVSTEEVKNVENLNTEILQLKEIETHLRINLNELNVEKEKLAKNYAVLKYEMDVLQNTSKEVEMHKNKVQEQNEQLLKDISKLQEIELENIKLHQELDNKKLYIEKYDSEIEELLLKMSKLVYDLQIKQENFENWQAQDTDLEIIEQNSKLLKINKMLKIVEEELTKEQESNKIIKAEKEELSSLIVKLEEKGKELHQSLHQHDSSFDAKVEKISHKYKQLESQFHDLNENFNSLKLESDMKDRKLCEIILEKSEVENEFDKYKIKYTKLEEELLCIKSELNCSESKLVDMEQNYSKVIKELQDKIEHFQNQLNLETKQKEVLMLEINKNKEACSIENNKVESNNLQSNQNTLVKLQAEKEQLIQTLQTKHLENVQYHEEIQRLNTLLSTQLNNTDQVSAQCSNLTKTNIELQQKIQEKDELLSNHQTTSDKQINVLKHQVESLQNQLEYVSQLLRVADRQEAEGQPSSDSQSLKGASNVTSGSETDHSCNIEELLENLNQEQLRNKYLQNEVQEQHERDQGNLKEIERLRMHLVNVEETYTQELVRAEEQIKELQLRLGQADERVKTSSTAYTSASIRANQQVESLGKQVRALTEQKEKMLVQVEAAEDKLLKQAAALTNLQVVLEQFQRDKEKDISLETERIRQILHLSEKKNNELCSEIKSLQLQLKEAKEGLNAASRLNEQLDRKSQTISELKQKVSELKEALTKADERVHAASLSVEGKVDRCLVRNLIIGYFCAPASSRKQALAIVATVLDLSQEDRQKIGLEASSRTDDMKQQTLSEAFVRFLENESRPQLHLRLPLAESDKESRSRKTSLSEVGLPSTRRTSGSALKDVLK
uniref:GRIP domain-containing protein n=1 Tax=Clastoptera arizonana TaxID=38151 RepID=A0A1B6DP96_9HEMI